jgi:hypothetical protein
MTAWWRWFCRRSPETRLEAIRLLLALAKEGK